MCTVHTYVCAYIHTIYVCIYTYIHTYMLYECTYGWMVGSNVFSVCSGTYEWMNGQTSIEGDSCYGQAQRETQVHWRYLTLCWCINAEHTHTHTHLEGTWQQETYALICNRGSDLILQTATRHLLSSVLMKLRRATVYILPQPSFLLACSDCCTQWKRTNQLYCLNHVTLLSDDGEQC